MNALIEAKEKAEVMAKTLGLNIGEPMVIEESPNRYSFNSNTYRSLRAAKKKKSSSLAIGNIKITVRVKVIFKLISHN